MSEIQKSLLSDQTDSLLSQDDVQNTGSIQDESSLINGEQSLIGDEPSLLGNEPSLINATDSMSFVELNNDSLTESQIESRKKYFSDPKNQAEILLQNYIRNQQVLVNRHQRKEIYKQYLRDAKKGKFRKLFHDSIYGISQDDANQKISKLNG